LWGPLQPSKLAAALEQTSAERPGQVMAALCPIEALAGQPMPPRPELAKIDAEHALEPHRSGLRNVDGFGLFDWADQSPISHRISDIDAELTGKVIIAGTRIAQRLGLRGAPAAVRRGCWAAINAKPSNAAAIPGPAKR
jgi:hypothetical protein